MPSTIVRTMVLAATLSLPHVACGPAAAPRTGPTDCEKECDLELMRCLETRICISLGGQRDPCLEECQAELADCTRACGRE